MGITDSGEKISVQEAKEVFRRIHALRKETQHASKNEVPIVVAEASALPWTDRLLAVISAIEPPAFERLCQRLLRESGFTRVEVTGKPSDGGIDGIGVLRMNLVSFQVLFQCKRWKGPVGANVVRDFRGAMVGRADKGLIVTTSTFTSDARKEATRDGASAIDLIDGENLCLLLKERKLGISIKLVEEIEVEERFFQSI